MFFDNKGTEMFYLEGIDLPFPATIFDLAPKKIMKLNKHRILFQIVI